MPIFNPDQQETAVQQALDRAEAHQQQNARRRPYGAVADEVRGLCRTRRFEQARDLMANHLLQSPDCYQGWSQVQVLAAYPVFATLRLQNPLLVCCGLACSTLSPLPLLHDGLECALPSLHREALAAAHIQHSSCCLYLLLSQCNAVPRTTVLTVSPSSQAGVYRKG